MDWTAKRSEKEMRLNGRVWDALFHISEDVVEIAGF